MFDQLTIDNILTALEKQSEIMQILAEKVIEYELKIKQLEREVSKLQFRTVRQKHIGGNR